MWEEVAKITQNKRKKRNISIVELFADYQFSKVILQFLDDTDVGKMTTEAKEGYGPPHSNDEAWPGDSGYREWRREEERTMGGVG